jgi:adenylate kinase family enzyme
MKKAKRILLIGSPASGKSYLSETIAQYLKLPVYHSDAIQVNLQRRQKLPMKKTMEMHLEYIESDKWIINGHDFGEHGKLKTERPSLKRVIERADHILFFDFSPEDCMKGYNQRLREVEKYKQEKKVLPRRLRGSNLNKPAWNKKGYFVKRKPELLKLLSPHKDTKTITVLKNTTDVRKLVSELQNNS